MSTITEVEVLQYLKEHSELLDSLLKKVDPGPRVGQLHSYVGRPKTLPTTSEAEFDNTLEEWEAIASAHGFPLDTVKLLATAVAPPEVKRAMTDVDAPSYETWKDTVARHIFNKPNQLRDIERKFATTPRQTEGSLHTIIEQFRRDLARHSTLCKRWDIPGQMSDYHCVQTLLRMVPAKYEAMLRLRSTTPERMTLAEVCEGLYNVEEVLGCFDLFSSQPVAPSLSKPKYTATQKKVTPMRGACFNCGETGHYSSNCDKKGGDKKKFTIAPEVEGSASSSDEGEN